MRGQPETGDSLPPGPRPLRIACINDAELVVTGIASMLSEYSDRVEVVELDGRLPVLSDVDLILFDPSAPNNHGLGLADLIRPGGPKVVVFTWPRSRHVIESALGGGAAGYLSKTLPAPDLVHALEDIHSGLMVTGPVEEPAPDPEADDWLRPEFGLSPREADVLALIAEGLTNQEIAVVLDLSINSLKSYIRFAYRKIGVQSRSGAVLWTLQHGFVVGARRSFPLPDQDGPQTGKERRGTHS